MQPPTSLQDALTHPGCGGLRFPIGQCLACTRVRVDSSDLKLMEVVERVREYYSLCFDCECASLINDDSATMLLLAKPEHYLSTRRRLANVTITKVRDRLMITVE